ncbi:hypothetical protein FGO68_gene11264 [Halteria grandinella]|uniref:Uncharacterized protein n=1 Tax=Halteria grandinella TaxID=5974 RepID=A0A8J8NNI1_HALGN|nr:hypothetical protein FGO68_gene11264 [Halteria grandinella]
MNNSSDSSEQIDLIKYYLGKPPPKNTNGTAINVTYTLRAGMQQPETTIGWIPMIVIIICLFIGGLISTFLIWFFCKRRKTAQIQEASTFSNALQNGNHANQERAPSINSSRSNRSRQKYNIPPQLSPLRQSIPTGQDILKLEDYEDPIWEDNERQQQLSGSDLPQNQYMCYSLGGSIGNNFREPLSFRNAINHEQLKNQHHAADFLSSSYQIQSMPQLSNFRKLNEDGEVLRQSIGENPLRQSHNSLKSLQSGRSNQSNQVSQFSGYTNAVRDSSVFGANSGRALHISSTFAGRKQQAGKPTMKLFDRENYPANYLEVNAFSSRNEPVNQSQLLSISDQSKEAQNNKRRSNQGRQAILPSLQVENL